MKKNIPIILLLLIFSFSLYSYGMGRMGLTDPDEVFYAQTAKEMLEGHSPLVPLMFGRPQFEKPVLFYWLLLAAFKVFGFTEWAARFWPAAFGSIGVVFTFLLGSALFGRRTGIYAALILSVSFLYLGLSRIALTDIVLTVFILISLFAFYIGYSRRREGLYIISYISSALAVLTKGPIGIIIPLFAAAAFLAARREWAHMRRFLLSWKGWAGFLLVALPWYLYISLEYGRQFTYGFFVHENLHRFFTAEHRSFNHWYFYPAVILLGLFPASGWMPFLFLRKDREHNPQRQFLYAVCAATFLFFAAAQSKLASYILPLFPALSILLADALRRRGYAVGGGRRLDIPFLSFLILDGAFIAALLYSGVWVKGNYPDVYMPWLAVVSIIVVAIFLSALFISRRQAALSLAFKVAGVFAALIASSYYIMPRIEGAFSDKMLAGRIKSRSGQIEDVLCNKAFVRGVYYYTGWPVLVMNEDKTPFYTPHPIPVVSTDDELERFFSAKEDILCVVKESDLGRIGKYTGGRRINRIVYKNNSRTVMLSGRRRVD